MKIDQHKVKELLSREQRGAAADELRREANVFFVGGNLPERETLETLFESHYQENASLFHLSFGEPDDFGSGANLARLIKKNFNAHLLGRLDYPATAAVLERAYVAGVDILDLPLGPGALEQVDARLSALEQARAIFPRWAVASTLVAGAEPTTLTRKKIDLLLEREVIPLLTLDRSAAITPEESSELFHYLTVAWRRSKALLKPLLPLIYLTSPLAPASARTGLRGFIDLIEGRRLLATSDLRRVLRVKEVEESFASSGL
ncbi:hypothetical protein GMLC_17130 [Geomonas limicola]|uniref:Pterin-binding domain-containing protein n=1 Tax=Geomonas limicola TaxID=2740186 RepID=A0A6V8N870_9BACT|nr:hypothetical protein [Geomonas limicola]GFO68134.1 hypothetical protein GMLC_17130 [Geomonas limicola]